MRNILVFSLEFSRLFTLNLGGGIPLNLLKSRPPAPEKERNVKNYEFDMKLKQHNQQKQSDSSITTQRRRHLTSPAEDGCELASTAETASVMKFRALVRYKLKLEPLISFGTRQTITLADWLFAQNLYQCSIFPQLLWYCLL